MIAVLLLCQIVCLSSNPHFSGNQKCTANASSKCYLGDRANHPPYSITALMKTKAFGAMLA